MEDSAAPDAHMGSKSIGLLGGVMLLSNNLAGPTISLMPDLARGAGWLAMLLVMGLLAAISAACGLLLLGAMQRMPGNEHFQRRVEFADVLKFYMHPVCYGVAMICYFAYLILTLMSYIIQTAQVLDYAALDLLGCAYGLELWPHFGGVCGTQLHATSPFGGATVFSVSFVLLAIVCVPLAWKNLDDNVVLQWVAIVGLCVLALFWLTFLVSRPTFPQHLPAFCPSSEGWLNLFGVLLFNFALMSSLPSWANEKRPDVSVGWSFLLSMGYVMVLYSLIGIVGGLSFGESQRGNLFSELNASGSVLNRLSVSAYPILQNLTSIPVFSIFIKYNLMQLGWLQHTPATLVSFVLPWVLSILFYTGKSFEDISRVGGLVFSVIVNFLVPVSLGVLALRRARADKATDAYETIAGFGPEDKYYGT
mmetsp:Transcript_48450/g.149689  ORF Transcript_48450/g.149689 Transcript_48450/m.149689 type:complete len:420 (-) Transcript_48450:61-1320(-)